MIVANVLCTSDKDTLEKLEGFKLSYKEYAASLSRYFDRRRDTYYLLKCKEKLSSHNARACIRTGTSARLQAHDGEYIIGGREYGERGVH